MTETCIIPIDEVVHETPEAYLIRIDRDKHWLPKSQCELRNDYGPSAGLQAVEMPEWLAERKGFV